ncbi:MAG: hypothetical protein E7047_08650 [Lentisphaerae bacterium]|nr:hypothetical protein [Lentisphaerota bacterium]
MITLSYSGGILLYLLIWLVTIGILWARELWRNRAYSWESNSRRILNCPGCHVSFTAPDNANVTRCPQCNSICFYRKR